MQRRANQNLSVSFFSDSQVAGACGDIMDNENIGMGERSGSERFLFESLS